MSNINTVLAEIKQLYKQAGSIMEKELINCANEIKKEHPSIRAVCWIQYTPYFNDGEPCEFGVGTPEFICANEDVTKERIIELWDDNNGYMEYIEDEEISNADISWTEYETLKTLFNSTEAEMLFLNQYGDHARVLIILDDNTCINSEYEHE